MNSYFCRFFIVQIEKIVSVSLTEEEGRREGRNRFDDKSINCVEIYLKTIYKGEQITNRSITSTLQKLKEKIR